MGFFGSFTTKKYCFSREYLQIKDCGVPAHGTARRAGADGRMPAGRFSAVAAEQNPDIPN